MIAAKSWFGLGTVVALGTAVVLLFGVAALGIVGDGGPPDLMYVGALVVGAVGALIARFRADGMAVALGAAALAVVVAGVVAFAAGLTDDASADDVVLLTAGFAAGFGLSAWLFRLAAGSRRGLAA